MQLDHAWIAARIPHHGAMCLLASIETWDHEHVVCTATSHHAAENPLRAHGRLAAAMGIEYAAQAMAVHGALLAEGTQQRQGYLASARDVQLFVSRLDTFAETLHVRATRMSGDEQTILYDFSVTAGTATLLRGRATVFMRPDLTQQA